MSNLNVLVVTHNSRLRCFLSKLMNGSKILRFKICAILKLTINIKNQKYKIEFLYEGDKGTDIDKSEDKFYGIKNDINSGFIGKLFKKKETQTNKGQPIPKTTQPTTKTTQPTTKTAQPTTKTTQPTTKTTQPFPEIPEKSIKLNLPFDTVTMFIVRHAEGLHNPKDSKYKSAINRLTSILQIPFLPLHIDPGLNQPDEHKQKMLENFYLKQK